MSLANENRNTASQDSRRVAGGIYCQMLGGTPETKTLIKLLKNYGKLPAYARIDPDTGWDKATGLAVVIPNHSVNKLTEDLPGYLYGITEEQKKITLASNPNDPRAALKAQAYVSEANRRLVEFLGDLVILVTLRQTYGKNMLPDARIHDVFIETQEVMPPEAYVVPKFKILIDPLVNKKITPGK